MMICNRAGKTASCKACHESKPHKPGPNMLPPGITVMKSFCMGEKSLAEVKLVKARDTTVPRSE